MELSSLIHRANQTYGLGLNEQQSTNVYWTLKQRFGANMTTAKTSEVLDAVLQTTDVAKRAARRPHNVYSGLKREVVAFDMRDCRRCQTEMREVLLVGDRKALYCLSCNITLPVKHA